MVSKVEHPRRHDPRTDKNKTVEDNTVWPGLARIESDAIRRRSIATIFLRFIAARNNSLTTRYEQIA